MLAIFSPLMVGLLLSGLALGGFLAGAILASQLLAVFMATSGAAWDNAKKTIEDGLYGGKGSEAHKASVVGDTVGDPLKDTAGPALNPMMKVINLISLLMGPLILQMSLMSGSLTFSPSLLIILVVVAMAALLAFGIWYSKRETELLREKVVEQTSKKKSK
jgi:K(+)-stimulated pyrophosphate-energized sodium pump